MNTDVHHNTHLHLQSLKEGHSCVVITQTSNIAGGPITPVQKWKLKWQDYHQSTDGRALQVNFTCSITIRAKDLHPYIQFCTLN